MIFFMKIFIMMFSQRGAGMRRDRLTRTSVLSIALFVAAMAQFSCGKNGIELSDLLGTWEFKNTITDAFTRDLIGEQMTLTLQDDLTYTVPGLNQPTINRFAFTSEVLRLIVHRGIPLTHLNHYFIFEGEMTGDGFLSGKIYSSQSPTDNDPMSCVIGSEIGGFTANRVSD